MAPQRIIAELQRALPVDGIVTCDAGENRIFMNHFFQTKSAGTFIQAAGAGPMGFAIPAAMSAKLLYPDSMVVAVCGDGGFAMTMNGLMTAIENDLPIVTVVLNNHALGWSMHSRGDFATRAQSDRRGSDWALAIEVWRALLPPRRFHLVGKCSRLGQFNHAAIARSIGCHGVSVQDPEELVGAFAAAFERRIPTVIDVETSLDTSFSDLMTPLAK